MTVFCEVFFSLTCRVALNILCVAFRVFTALSASRFLENYCKRVEGALPKLLESFALMSEVSSQEFGRHHALLK